MEQVLSLPREAKPTRKKKKISSPSAQLRAEIVSSIQSTQIKLKQAHVNFNLATDYDLIESYIYEINSLQSLHNYLLRTLRGLEE